MQITLLGFTAELGSLLLETIHLLYPGAQVVILENIPRRNDLPFKAPGVEVRFEQLASISKKPPGGCALCLGTPDGKNVVWNIFKEQLDLTEDDLITLIHPRAVIASTARIGKGVYIEPGAIVSPFAEVGDMVTLNRGCTIGHHTRIGRLSAVNPGCHIGGRTTVGEVTQIGIGSSVFDNVQIGSNTLVGAGSVVTKDVPDNVIAFGVPCEVKRHRST